MVVMKRTFAVLLAASVIVLGSGATFAHHSFSATYFDDKEQTIEGDMVQFMYRNPHSFVHVMDKQNIRWAIEWGGGGQLSRQGVTRETLKYGDHVIITGAPARNPDDHRLRMKTIFRPKDGWKWGGVVE
jgi:hypothetical protein